MHTWNHAVKPYWASSDKLRQFEGFSLDIHPRTIFDTFGFEIYGASTSTLSGRGC
jgi:hypothetical protein